MINKSPIYQQLNKALRELIAENNYEIGDKFLTERAICEKYGISRATANKALSSLVSEGLLEFKKGVGTFIKSKPVSGGGVPILNNFTGNARQSGMRTSSRIRKTELIKGSELESEITDFLKIEPEERVFKIESLKMAEETPMVHEYTYIIAKYCPDLTNQNLSGSLYNLLREKYNLEITRSEETIQAVNLSEEDADLLGSKKGKAGFAVLSICLIDEEVPLLWEKSVYRPDSIEFHCIVAKDQKQQRLSGRFITDD